VAGDRAVVVEPQQHDRVADVVVRLDPAGRVARLAGEDRVVVDPALLVELVPYGLRKAGMEDVVPVQVADLPPLQPEGELPARARSRLDARPGRDLLGDLLTRCLRPRHGCLLKA